MIPENKRAIITASGAGDPHHPVSRQALDFPRQLQGQQCSGHSPGRAAHSADEVIDMDGRRIDKVLMQIEPAAADGAESEE